MKKQSLNQYTSFSDTHSSDDNSRHSCSPGVGELIGQNLDVSSIGYRNQTSLDSRYFPSYIHHGSAPNFQSVLLDNETPVESQTMELNDLWKWLKQCLDQRIATLQEKMKSTTPLSLAALKKQMIKKSGKRTISNISTSIATQFTTEPPAIYKLEITDEYPVGSKNAEIICKNLGRSTDQVELTVCHLNASSIGGHIYLISAPISIARQAPGIEKPVIVFRNLQQKIYDLRYSFSVEQQTNITDIISGSLVMRTTVQSATPDRTNGIAKFTLTESMMRLIYSQSRCNFMITDVR